VLGIGTTRYVQSEVAGTASVRVEYYEIQGATPEELRREMDRLGPLDDRGRRRDAFARWRISWSWPLKSSGKPDFAGAMSQFEGVMTLPRWLGREDASTELIERWDHFMAAVRRHEEGHLGPAREATPQVAEAIRAAAGLNPGLTIREAHRIAEAVVRSVRAHDREYDERTRNGQTEGVRWP